MAAAAETAFKNRVLRCHTKVTWQTKLKWFRGRSDLSSDLGEEAGFKGNSTSPLVVYVDRERPRDYFNVPKLFTYPTWFERRDRETRTEPTNDFGRNTLTIVISSEF